MKYISLIIPLVLVLSGCTSSEENNDVITEEWKKDRDGCGGVRAKSIEKLSDYKDQLLRLSTDEVLDLLGKPDRSRIYERSQRFYIYFLNPSEKCENGKEDATYFQLRFNALGFCSEALIIRK